ncbi:hypothetical protein ACT3CD_12745 [Geofilum sp. OHC36d9]|uniref:hypothetical protein n=1 Tax=Geofilum sp. OHC36d9 TaxID=3458413 RepID=UPI0040340DD8
MRTIIISGFLLINLTVVFGQNEIKRDTVYETRIIYKNENPDQVTKQIAKSDIREIIEITTNKERTDNEIDSIQNLIWNAIKNPVDFDSLYMDFSRSTLGSGCSQKKDGTIVKEPKPFLAEWSVADSEKQYARFVIDFILTNFHVISYGDNSDGVQAAFYQILQTRDIKIDGADFNGGTYNYIKDINSNIFTSYNKVALVEKGYYTIFVCDKNNKNRLIELLLKIDWKVIEP